MGISIRQNSRLVHANVVVAESTGLEFWDLPEYPIIEKRDDDLLYNVTETDRIDQIATKYYGDPNLWWVVALANDIRHIPNDLAKLVGYSLRIPSPRYVFSNLLKKKVR